MIADEVITPAVRSRIESAIRQAEKGTSAEIRVHIEDECKEDVLDRAAYIFADLNMHKTKLRNGVLIYVAVEHRKLAILGDGGINGQVENNFWQSVRDAMIEHLAKDQIEAGVMKAVMLVGEKIKALFPFQAGDINELSNSVTTGKSSNNS